MPLGLASWWCALTPSRGRRRTLTAEILTELSYHLGYRPGATKPEDASNHRNGASGKTVLTEDGPLRIEVPRDREGSFEPLLIPKHERRFTGFDDKIVAMCARGMTVREIQGFLAEQYGTEVTPDFISSVTDAVMAEVGAWQARAQWLREGDAAGRLASHVRGCLHHLPQRTEALAALPHPFYAGRSRPFVELHALRVPA